MQASFESLKHLSFFDTKYLDSKLWSHFFFRFPRSLLKDKQGFWNILWLSKFKFFTFLLDDAADCFSLELHKFIFKLILNCKNRQERKRRKEFHYKSSQFVKSQNENSSNANFFESFNGILWIKWKALKTFCTIELTNFEK